MKTVFESCIPREDVLKGALTEEIFAADLQAVVDGTAPEVYKNPEVFFKNSYPTEGLKTLVSETFARFVKGKASSPVLRLETSFGGGKTHNLIALWHIARDPVLARACADWIEGSAIPDAPVNVVALSCDKYGADEVCRHDDVATRTLWGEIGWRLGDYGSIQRNDDERLAPSEAALNALFAGKQILLLLDELAAYLRSARGKRVGGGTLADQTLRFFHTLLVHAASHDNLVVVYTLAESKDAYSRETEEISEQVRESRSLSARQERVITPTSEREVAEIIKRRLFERVDTEAARDTAEAYVAWLAKCADQGAALPVRATDPNLKREFEVSYPFHPELLTTLYRKTASINNFQRTRGLLRLLAAMTRLLWEKRHAQAYVIHAGDVDLSSETIRNELTSRLDRGGLATAVAADIWSDKGDAHAQKLDEDWAARGYSGLCRRVSQVIFLHSLVSAKETAVGADLPDVMLATLYPGLSFDLVEKALDQIDSTFWYADFDGRRYYFKEDATLKKLISEAAGGVGIIKAKDALREKIAEVFGNGGIFSPPAFFPSGPQEVPDEPGKPLLVVMDFDHLTFSSASQEIPRVVEEIFRRKGETLGFRSYQNNLVVLVCEESEKARLIEAAKRYKGIESLYGSAAVKQQLSKDNLKRLKEARDTSGLEFLVSVTNAYRHLFFPSTVSGGIEHHQMPPQDANGAKRSQQAVIRDKLVELQQALKDGCEPLAPEYVLDKAWPENAQDVTTGELERIFRKKPRLYMLFDVEPLRATIRSGVEKGLWVYYDGNTVYRKQNPPLISSIRFDSSCELMTPDRAESLYPSVSAGGPKTPQNGKSPYDVIPGGGGPGSQPGVPGGGRQPQKVRSAGAVPRAFAEIRDLLAERDASEIRRIVVDVTGAQNTAAMMSIWPSLLSMPADLWVSQRLTARVSENSVMQVSFEGPGKYYQRIKQAIESATGEFGGSAEYFSSVQVYLTFTKPISPRDDVVRILENDMVSRGFGEIALHVEYGEEKK